MAEEIRATTQYGDMSGEISGTISVDGWNGLSAAGLGEACGKGFWPVGIRIYDSRSDTKGFDPDIYALVVDTDILDDPKDVHGALKRYAELHGQIPVFPRSTKLKLRDLLPLLKRFDIVLQIKALGDVPLVRPGKDSIFPGAHEQGSDE